MYTYALSSVNYSAIHRILHNLLAQVAYLGSIDAQLRQSSAQLSGSQMRVISDGGVAVSSLNVAELEVRMNSCDGTCWSAANSRVSCAGKTAALCVIQGTIVLMSPLAHGLHDAF